MTTFTDITAAIEEAVWLAAKRRFVYAVYQKTAYEMEVGIYDPLSYAMFTTNQGGTVVTPEIEVAA